jgi:hypothetical protein
LIASALVRFGVGQHGAAGVDFQACFFDTPASVPPNLVENQMLTGDDSGQRGFKSCPEDRSAATVVVIGFLLKGICGGPQPAVLAAVERGGVRAFRLLK